MIKVINDYGAFLGSRQFTVNWNLVLNCVVLETRKVVDMCLWSISVTGPIQSSPIRIRADVTSFSNLKSDCFRSASWAHPLYLVLGQKRVYNPRECCRFRKDGLPFWRMLFCHWRGINDCGQHGRIMAMNSIKESIGLFSLKFHIHICSNQHITYGRLNFLNTLPSSPLKARLIDCAAALWAATIRSLIIARATRTGNSTCRTFIFGFSWKKSKYRQLVSRG